MVEGLRKDYGTVRAVDGVSFQVRRGEIYALLGPNGAGKTSTVEILEGHRRRSGGSVRVLGFDPGAGDRHFRERAGIVLQSGGMDAELTVREMVSLFASFYTRLRDVAETIEQVGLAAKRRARVRTLLNACYVTVITSMVLAREEGMLKRLRGTPLPAWGYLAGRFGSAFVTSVIASGVIIATGVAFFRVSIVWHALGYFAAAAFLGIACFFLVGAAVTTVVPKTDTALPIAFGTMLPLAFISGVFFPVSHPPAWLHHLASAFPVTPIAQAMEDCFNPATQSWPMPASGLLVVLGWSAAAIAVIALAFRWEPSPAPAARGLGRSPRSAGRPRHGL